MITITFTEMRTKKGFITQKMLSTKLGINSVNVNRWEKGVRYPRPAMLIRLAEILDVPERDIIQAITDARNENKKAG